MILEETHGEFNSAADILLSMSGDDQEETFQQQKGQRPSLSFSVLGICKDLCIYLQPIYLQNTLKQHKRIYLEKKVPNPFG